MRARRRSWLAAIAFHPPGELAQFGLGNRALQLVELLVQQANVLAVSEPERGEVRLRAGEFAGPLNELGVELGQPRAQAVYIVVMRLRGADQRQNVPSLGPRVCLSICRIAPRW